MNQFEIYSIEFGPAKGAALKKITPSVIISPGVMNNNLTTVIVAPLTTDIKGYPSRIIIEFEEQEFEIVLDQMRAVDKSRLKRKLGAVDENTAVKIKAIARTIFS